MNEREGWREEAGEVKRIERGGKREMEGTEGGGKGGERGRSE